ALDGDTALVGAPDVTDTVPGAVYLFTRRGTVWSREASLTTGKIGDFYGKSVAVHGDTAVVGAPQRAEGSARGAVFVYARTGAAWAQTQELRGVAGTFDMGLVTALDGVTLALTNGAPIGPHAYALDGDAL